MKYIDGGVCAPVGFKANGMYAGFRKNKNKKDLSLIVSEKKGTAASCYTSNLVKGAPIYVTKDNLVDGYAQAIICNSGNANTCNADGVDIASKTCELLAKELNISSKDIIVASTGVIGQPLSIEPFKNNISTLVSGLDSTLEKARDAFYGIMTTDTTEKQIALEFMLDGKVCHIGGMCKGSGMIHPQMATMLCFITTDVAITSSMLDKALHEAVDDTFNMVSVDGDTSTNDMVSIIANGMALNKEINSQDDNYKVFYNHLYEVMKELAKKIAKDGEGATKLLNCIVKNAKTKNDAKLVAKAVICSSLFKAAMFGADANWGRVLCAIGYSKANVDINKIDVSFSSIKGSIDVCSKGSSIDFSEEKAKEILLMDEIDINIDLHDGLFDAVAYGCDLTYDYVKINGDYRS